MIFNDFIYFYFVQKSVRDHKVVGSNPVASTKKRAVLIKTSRFAYFWEVFKVLSPHLPPIKYIKNIVNY